MVSGVSGSGKSSLVIDALVPVLRHELEGAALAGTRLAYGAVSGLDGVKRVLMVNQSAIGKNSRSCPATYIGIMAMVRGLFAALPEARVRGYAQSRFSYNVRGGRCEACEGMGVQKLQMSFLPQLEITCPVCDGERFNSETRQVRFKGRSIADVLDLTASEAFELFADIPSLAQQDPHPHRRRPGLPAPGPELADPFRRGVAAHQADQGAGPAARAAPRSTSWTSPRSACISTTCAS